MSKATLTILPAPGNCSECRALFRSRSTPNSQRIATTRYFCCGTLGHREVITPLDMKAPWCPLVITEDGDE